MAKISVLLSGAENERFTAYCQEKGFKKSTLTSRLIREHLDREGYASQRQLALQEDAGPPGRSTRRGSARGRRGE